MNWFDEFWENKVFIEKIWDNCCWDWTHHLKDQKRWKKMRENGDFWIFQNIYRIVTQNCRRRYWSRCVKGARGIESRQVTYNDLGTWTEIFWLKIWVLFSVSHEFRNHDHALAEGDACHRYFVAVEIRTRNVGLEKAKINRAWQVFKLLTSRWSVWKYGNFQIIYNFSLIFKFQITCSPSFKFYFR